MKFFFTTPCRLKQPPHEGDDEAKRAKRTDRVRGVVIPPLQR